MKVFDINNYREINQEHIETVKNAVIDACAKMDDSISIIIRMGIYDAITVNSWSIFCISTDDIYPKANRRIKEVELNRGKELNKHWYVIAMPDGTAYQLFVNVLCYDVDKMTERDSMAEARVLSVINDTIRANFD